MKRCVLFALLLLLCLTIPFLSAQVSYERLLRAAEESHAALLISTHDPAVSSRLAEQWTVSDGRVVVKGIVCSH